MLNLVNLKKNLTMGKEDIKSFNFNLFYFLRSETCGMVKKAFTNLQKLATICACARETFNEMSSNGAGDRVPDFQVRDCDVEIAFDILKLAVQTYKNFKVRYRTMRTLFVCTLL